MKKRYRVLKYEFGEEALLRPIVSRFYALRRRRHPSEDDERSLMWMAKVIFRVVDRYRSDWLFGGTSCGLEVDYLKDFPRRYCDELMEEIGRLSREAAAMPRPGGWYGKIARLHRLRCDLEIARSDQLIEQRVATKSKYRMSTQELAVREIKKRSAALPKLRELLAELKVLRSKAISADAEIEWEIESTISREKACWELLDYWKKLEAQAHGFVDVEEVLAGKDLQPYVKSTPVLAAEFAAYLIEALQRLPKATRVARMMGTEIQQSLESGMKEDVAFLAAWDEYFGRPVSETVTSISHLGGAKEVAMRAQGGGKASSDEGKRAELLRKKIAAMEKEESRIHGIGGERPGRSGT